jgi:hypothetical protein
MRQLWCRREITQLGQEALHVSELQDKLLKKLDLLESHQGEIYKTLTTVEEEAGKMFDDEEPFRDPLETKRINLYERAIKVSEQLNQCVSLLNSSACLARVLLCNGCLQMVERTTAHSTGAV